ncbi:ribosome small subunit-dependent GTPase A [Halobacillus locisalis]|uniref:Small ribosomal subunit biogenesis GTPase RsgA n=1 Tax=Halobacillus locisalis TaxID=220753 RepID=A0A838CS07_9BACI|nr:ribosome small subunit-dependent GTPase A [Halobacillus locisalis]MBA2174396.1 ribosome small subunit-dependent GTPase A [Halobacillus locisalis]
MQRVEEVKPNNFFVNQCKENEQLGRVLLGAHGIYTLLTMNGTLEGRLSGRFHHELTEARDYPAVGDWVVYVGDGRACVIIQRVLNRRTLLSRKKAGTTTDEQVMVSNVDVVFIVTALTKEFNVRRIERYVHQVYESCARPVIICTKKDLCEDVTGRIGEVERVAPGVPVYATNNLTGEGMADIMKECVSGETITLIGSSGVGKSTLINHMLNAEVQDTKDARSKDDRGRHTTTHRELFTLSNGAFMIDTPGMRELQLWGDSDTIDQTFEDIEAYSHHCKFRDCSHSNEPQCEVLRAIDDGELDDARLINYHKLKRELKRLELKEKYGSHRTNRMLHGPNKI